MTFVALISCRRSCLRQAKTRAGRGILAAQIPGHAETRLSCRCDLSSHEQDLAEPSAPVRRSSLRLAICNLLPDHYLNVARLERPRLTLAVSNFGFDDARRRLTVIDEIGCAPRGADSTRGKRDPTRNRRSGFVKLRAGKARACARSREQPSERSGTVAMPDTVVAQARRRGPTQGNQYLRPIQSSTDS